MKEMKDLKIIGIYRILNCITNKCYVGSSINVLGRLSKHMSWLKHNKHQNKKLQNSVNKHGLDNFKFELVVECKVEKLESLEQYYIDQFGHYNITKIVERNIPSIQSRKKHSKTKKKLFKLRLISKTTKKTYQYSLEGNFLKEYASLNDACKEVGGVPSTLIRCITGVYKSAKGYYWSHEFLGNKIPKINVSRRSILKNSRSKQFKLTNINTGKVIKFDSFKLVCLFLKTNQNNLRQYYYKNLTYKGKYKIDLVKLDKLLETPEEDNQQPIIKLNT